MNTSPLHARLDAPREQIAGLCRRHHVRRLDLFGSAAVSRDTEGSDYDFLVEFKPLPPGGYADAYFGLLEDLQALLGAPVELVAERAIGNPYYRQAMEAQRVPVYPATARKHSTDRFAQARHCGSQMAYAGVDDPAPRLTNAAGSP